MSTNCDFTFLNNNEISRALVLALIGFITQKFVTNLKNISIVVHLSKFDCLQVT